MSLLKESQPSRVIVQVENKLPLKILIFMNAESDNGLIGPTSYKLGLFIQHTHTWILTDRR